MGWSAPCLAQETIVQPVDSDKRPDRATFAAGYERVWEVVFGLLERYEFGFHEKNRETGRFETGYVVFSRSERFSRLNKGVKAFGSTPLLFLRKWIDARMKVFVDVKSVNSQSTQVIVTPDIQGYASSVFDETGVTGEWKQCKSNGKFEFEFLNEIATELKSAPAKPAAESPTVSSVPQTRLGSEEQLTHSSNLFVQSAPEGAEIHLNGQLVGMTPARLSLPPGDYKVVLRKKGFKDYQRDVLILAGSDITVSVEMEQ
ncbi:MAG: PEGA domain-containing protein [Acidobacteriota bacterium]